MARFAILAVLGLAACSVAGAKTAPESEAPAMVRGYVAGVDVAVAQAEYTLEDVADDDRLLVRKGALTLRTANPEEVGARARERVRAAGGYLVQQRNDSFVFRIPAARFPEAFDAVAAMGAVVQRSLDVQDVTDEVRDLELRLKNARALRDRYAQILERAEKVEDVLALERELAKVTGEIERLEAQLENRQRDIAFSLLALTLERVAGPGIRHAKSPFPWIGSIGLEHLPEFRPERAGRSRVRWRLPADFADMGRTREDEVLAWAYSPDGLRVVVRRFENRPEMGHAFWEKEILRELVEVRGYQPEEGPAPALRFRSLVSGVPTRYALRLIVTERAITLVEVIGPVDLVESRWTALAAIVDSVANDAR